MAVPIRMFHGKFGSLSTRKVSYDRVALLSFHEISNVRAVVGRGCGGGNGNILKGRVERIIWTFSSA